MGTMLVMTDSRFPAAARVAAGFLTLLTLAFAMTGIFAVAKIAFAA